MAGYRWRRITAALPAVVGWMIEGQTTSVTCIRGLPKGTVCVGAIEEDLTRVSLVVEHESFDEIRAAVLSKEDIPLHPDPTFRTHEQQQAAVEDRYKQQMARLLDDVAVEPQATPEDVRVALRNTILGLREQVKEARHARLPLHDRIAQLESAAQSRT